MINDKNGAMVQGWHQYFDALRALYESNLRYSDPDHPQFGKVEPANPKTGLIAYADGDPVNGWDPKGDGTAGQFYYKADGTWQFMA